MKRLSVSALLLLAGLAVVFAKEPIKPFAYPPAPKSEQSDDYHGTTVADPYRPLENADSPETKKWIEAENKLTFKFLEGIPERKKINQRLTKLWNYEKYGVPYREGDRYFFTKNTGLQNQSVLYTAPKLPGESKMLLDPNTLSKDGTTALTGTDVSKDGKLFAYGLAMAGSDWQEWKVREIESGKDRDDVIKWVKFSNASWNGDGTGFFYSRYDEPAADQLKAANYFHKLYFHRLGTPQSEDKLIYERKDHKEWLFDGQVTEDAAYLIITVSEGTESKNRVFYQALTGDEKPVVELLDKQDAEYVFLGNDGPVFWFRTTFGACLTQRPDLWGATLPGVGVLDMLRFQKFTIGWAWASDYGSSENAEEFQALYKYSPLHNIKPGTKYPPTLITTADHDDRVFPGHSFKFAAALQAAQAGPAPILIRIETRAGHGAGKPTSKQIEDVTDQWSFLVKTLGMKVTF